MVLASWSLEEVGDTGRGGGTNQQGGNSREERFNALAGPALERLNEQRREAGQPELAALPFEEEQRIRAQVDAGGGGGTGTGQHRNQPAPIRNWHDFGAAVQSDLLDEIGGTFGIDVAELMGRDSSTTAAQPAAPAAAGSSHPATPSRPGAAAQPGADPHHDDHHHPDDRKIETDHLDLDELGTRLYDRIRSRLRMELLLDRERAGLLSDFR
jgi:hypothetical protein